jgi:hypothetical protein
MMAHAVPKDASFSYFCSFPSYGPGVGMKRLLVCALFAGLLNSSIEGQIPNLMSYQGILSDATGLVNGDVSLTFRIYEADTDGTSIWEETHSTVSVDGGVFSVTLGSQTPIDAPFDASYWLGITIDGGVEQTPRTPLLPAPYALNARRVELAPSLDQAYREGSEIIADAGAVTIGGPGGLLVEGMVETDLLKLHQGGQDGYVLTYAGSTGLAEWRASSAGVTTGGSGWGLAGNASTDPETQYLGTSDDTPLELRVNGEQALRIEPVEGTSNTINGHNANNVFQGAFGATIGGGGGHPPGQSQFLLTQTVTDIYGTVSGGLGNTAGSADADPEDSPYATVSGGYQNHASKRASTVIGGWMNGAEGQYSTVVGGLDNRASGDYAVAAGRRAKAIHDGAFVWGDAASSDVESTADNQFTVRASGGVRIFTDGALSSGSELAAGSGSWSTLSDRNAKANFRNVSGERVLERLDGLQIQNWNYRTQSTSIRHIGPTAQDFSEAFGVGEDDRHISSVDADGVALAAIQGLYRVVKSKDEEIQVYKKRVLSLEQRLNRLEALVGRGASESVPEVQTP